MERPAGVAVPRAQPDRARPPQGEPAASTMAGACLQSLVGTTVRPPTRGGMLLLPQMNSLMPESILYARSPRTTG